MIRTFGFTMIPMDTPLMHDGTHFPGRPHARQMREAAEAVGWLMLIFDDQSRRNGRPFVPYFVLDPSKEYAETFTS